MSSGDDEADKVKPKKKDLTPYSDIVDAYHKHLPAMKGVIALNAKRKLHMRALFKECKRMEEVIGFFIHVNSCDLLMGRVTNWIAGFDYLINPSNFLKICENSWEKD